MKATRFHMYRQTTRHQHRFLEPNGPGVVQSLRGHQAQQKGALFRYSLSLRVLFRSRVWWHDERHCEDVDIDHERNTNSMNRLCMTRRNVPPLFVARVERMANSFMMFARITAHEHAALSGHFYRKQGYVMYRQVRVHSTSSMHDH